MKQILLKNGGLAFVDDIDYESINSFAWRKIYNGKTRKIPYAVRHVKTDLGWRMIGMHRQIMGVSDPNVFVDHKDHNGLNNTRNNLRIASHSENQVNSRRKGVINKYRGVYFIKRSGRYQAQIRKNSRCYTIGTFDSEIEAARQFDIAAKLHHGEFAVLNFPI